MNFTVYVIINNEFKISATKQRTVSKEFKLKVIKWYFGNGKNINKATNIFKIWLKNEEKICSLKGSRNSCRYGKTNFPLMKKKLFQIY